MNPRKALSKFLDAIGGIPEDNRNPLFGHINEQLRSIFLKCLIRIYIVSLNVKSENVLMDGLTNCLVLRISMQAGLIPQSPPFR